MTFYKSEYKDIETYPDHWDNLNLFPEWYFNNGWSDVVTQEATVDALLKAVEEMRNNEIDQWKRQQLMMILDGIRILKDMNSRKELP